MSDLIHARKKPRHSLLAAAHALHALTSLFGILGIPAVIVHACPTAPIAQPFICLVRLSGGWLPLVWVFGSLALWLLLLNRIYHFKGAWDCLWERRGSQPPAPADPEQARRAACCLRME